mmetsp:Transcript_40431/g.90884  ORF Transcript_40431/g.90884 Transcript_40431/m.90884 type:complete len:239 (-) Transcript_40431:62-778(-)
MLGLALRPVSVGLLRLGLVEQILEDAHDVVGPVVGFVGSSLRGLRLTLGSLQKSLQLHLVLGVDHGGAHYCVQARQHLLDSRVVANLHQRPAQHPLQSRDGASQRVDGLRELSGNHRIVRVLLGAHLGGLLEVRRSSLLAGSQIPDLCGLGLDGGLGLGNGGLQVRNLSGGVGNLALELLCGVAAPLGVLLIPGLLVLSLSNDLAPHAGQQVQHLSDGVGLRSRSASEHGGGSDNLHD